MALRKGIGYVRVSRVSGRDQKNGGESFLAPEIQRERIEAIAKASGIRIVAWFEDRDQSGKREDRPGYQAAHEAVETGQASVIVVARMSRAHRNVLHLEKALQRLEAAGAQLVAGDLNVDTTTPQGKLMRTILAAIAQFELEVTTEQWAESKAKAIGNGVKISNRPPLGYRWNADEQGERVDDERPARSLVPDPQRGTVIGELFRLRATGGSATELVELWHERTGERQPRQTLMYALRNRAYLGEVHQGKLVEPGAHEPLVSVEEFEAVQTVRVPRGPRNGEGSLLAGVLVCAGCGRPMTATASNGRKARYVCQNMRADCPAQASVLQELADPEVERQFLAWARKRAAVEGTGAEAAQLEQALSAAETAQAELDAYQRATSVLADPDAFAAGALSRQAALDDARERVAELRASGRVETLHTSVNELWPELTLPERRKLLAAGIERVVVHSSSGRALPFAERSEPPVFRAA